MPGDRPWLEERETDRGVRFLYPIIKTLDNPQVRLCWDWEHSYANGLDLTKEGNKPNPGLHGDNAHKRNPPLRGERLAP